MRELSTIQKREKLNKVFALDEDRPETVTEEPPDQRDQAAFVIYGFTPAPPNPA